MFRKTLTTTVAALTIAGSTLTAAQPAQAGFGKLLAVGLVGAAVGAIAAGSARSQEPTDRSGYRPVRGYEGGCGYRKSPVFDEYGNRVGFRTVPAC